MGGLETDEGSILVKPLPEETVRKARLEVVRQVADPTEAQRLFAMLGLDVQPERRTGCKVCGGPMPVYALAPKAGMRGCCSAACKRRAADPDFDPDAAAPEQAAPAPVAAPEVAAALEVLRAPEWMDDAACPGWDPELWHPVGIANTDLAVAICRSCPVRQACEDYAVDKDISDGIWGGHRLDDEEERTALRAAHGVAIPGGGQQRTCPACGEEYVTRQKRAVCRACELGLIPDKAAHDHVVRLRGYGATLKEIAEAAEISEYAVSEISRERSTRILPEVSERILALTGVGSAVPV